MKWDRLRLFNIVAQTRNITEASYILQMSQSALSRQMKALENELGIINYHKVGLLISVSSLAIFEFKNKIMQSYFKYIPLLLGLVFLINLGSRSNIVIIFLFIIFKIFKNFKFNKKNIISLITLGSLLTLIILL